MAERLRRKDIKEDELVAAIAAARSFIKRYRTAILAVAAVVLVGVIVSAAMAHSRAEARREIGNQISEALLLMQAMEFQRAALLLESVLERHPGGPRLGDLLFHTATAQYMTGNYDRALALFEQCVSGKVKDRLRRFAAREGIADCYQQKGDLLRAAALYEEIAPDAPLKDRTPMLLAQAGSCYERAGNLDAVERIATRLVNEFGQNKYWIREGDRLAARAKALREAAAD